MNQKLNKRTVLLMVFRGIFAILASQLIILITYTEGLANMNVTLVSDLLNLTPFLVAIVFYFYFNESLNKFYLIGICLIAISAVMTGHSTAIDTSIGV